jgi:hypothetical protein
MNDRELAEMIEGHIKTYPSPAPVIGLLQEQWDRIIAALRRSQPEGEPATEAVRDQELVDAAYVILGKHKRAVDFREADQHAADLVALVIRAAERRALKGKGASQGANDMVTVPREPTEKQRHMAMMNDSPSYRTGSLTFYRAMLQAAEASKDTEGRKE